MNKRIQKMWIKALLSGEFEQGRNALWKGGPFFGSLFCCLGVACELHRRETRGPNWHKLGGFHEYLGSNDFMPREVLKWAKLSKSDQEELAMLNDESSITFAEIAGVIERL